MDRDRGLFRFIQLSALVMVLSLTSCTFETRDPPSGTALSSAVQISARFMQDYDETAITYTGKLLSAGPYAHPDDFSTYSAAQDCLEAGPATGAASRFEVKTCKEKSGHHSGEWEFTVAVTGKKTGMPVSHIPGSPFTCIITLVSGDQKALQVVEQVVAGNKCLTPEGSGQEFLPRVAAEQLVLYLFEEGAGVTVHDVSLLTPPLDLTIADQSAVTWMVDEHGLSIDSATLASTGGPAWKVTDNVRSSNEITIEAWVRPDNVTQTGPARIFTLSSDANNRNFTLGQNGPVFDVRLRTTQTSSNGTPSLRTENNSVTANLTHIVYTYSASSGEANIYLNGLAVPVLVDPDPTVVIGGVLSNWDASYRLGLANEFTNDRPWMGDYHLLSIYSRALSEAEVVQNFQAGF